MNPFYAAVPSAVQDAMDGLAALEGLHRIEAPGRVTSTRELPAVVPAHAPEFVRTITAMMMAGHGDDLPVSALPADGNYPSGTAGCSSRYSLAVYSLIVALRPPRPGGAEGSRRARAAPLGSCFRCR